LPTSPFYKVAGDISKPTRVNHACARCHQVLFSRYPWTWEGGKRRSAQPGGSNINSGEARDMLLGACKGISCVDCHDVHGGRPLKSENAVCTRCHGAYENVAAHSHHPASVTCVACHMAEKNMSLTSTLTRYHRIGSPTDPMRVMLDRPLECAICHQDKTVEQVTLDMERLFGKRYERETLRQLYGDLGANVMTATLGRGKPHEQAVALFVLGRARRKDVAAQVAGALVHPYPLVREYARDALDRLLGTPCDVDLADARERIAEKARKCLELQGIRAEWAAPAGPGSEDERDEGED
jgi:hypothetical protein